MHWTLGLFALTSLFASSLGSPLIPPPAARCPPVKDGTFGICVMACSSDEDCSDGRMCCSNGCGFTCQTPVPDVLCPRLLCNPKEDCPYGHETDANGCPTCICKLSPCAMVRCAVGTECTVRNGQAVCEEICPSVKCQKCAYGYVFDNRGCQTCRCMPNPCAAVKCERNQKCEIRWPPCRPDRPCYPLAVCVDLCPVRQCRPCEFGYVTDRNGCQTCLCLPNPCDDFECPAGQRCEVLPFKCDFGQLCPVGLHPACVDECPRLLCKECEFGNVIDKNGCRTCECNLSPCEMVDCPDGQSCVLRQVTCVKAPCDPVAVCEPAEVSNPCPMPTCDTKCEFGYKYTDDWCMTCDCIENPCTNHTCNPGQECYLQQVMCIRAPCPPLPMCRDPCPLVRCAVPCPNGYVTTKDGCQTCECLPDPDPCSTHICEPHEECYLQPVQCIRAPCPSVPACRDRCTPVLCKMACPGGFKKDKNGCEICECENTCALVDCKPGYECKIKEGGAICELASETLLPRSD